MGKIAKTSGKLTAKLAARTGKGKVRTNSIVASNSKETIASNNGENFRKVEKDNSWPK